MKEQINQIIEFLKVQDIKACITGSSLLGEYWDGMDVDCFVYDKSSFIELFNVLRNDPRYLILDELEQWKADKFRKNVDQFAKTGMITIKFIYNTCIPVNIIFKKDYTNIFSILSSFDMDIICKGYDIQTKITHDFTYGSNLSKIASWNRLNTNFYDPELWQMNRILRQFDRILKYHRRGYNTDSVVLKYIEIIDSLLKINDIFHSSTFSEKLDLNKKNALIIKQICLTWLDNHNITDEEIKLLNLKVREL